MKEETASRPGGRPRDDHLHGEADAGHGGVGGAEILKVAERPDVLSFAGGLPAPELFPARELGQAFEAVLRKSLGAALQYGITEGFLPLRAWVADRLRARGIAATPESVAV